MASITLTFDPDTGALTSSGILEVPLESGEVYPIDLTGSMSLESDAPGWVDTSSFTIPLDTSEEVVQREIVGVATPSQNLATSTFTNKSSLTAYDVLGNRIQLDIFYSKGDNGTWQMSVFNHADASAGGFPYGVEGSAPLAEKMLMFDPVTGELADSDPIEISLSDGSSLSLSIDGTTQLAADFSVGDANVNGNGASAVSGYTISEDGVLSMRYADGSLVASYRIPLADVSSPDKLTVSAGNVFTANGRSGVTTLGFPGQAGFGSITSGAIEQSNVDLASELTEMIESQRSYSANSKVFQTSADLLDLLVKLGG